MISDASCGGHRSRNGDAGVKLGKTITSELWNGCLFKDSFNKHDFEGFQRERRKMIHIP